MHSPSCDFASSKLADACTRPLNKLSYFWEMIIRRKLDTFIDLFAGIGGFNLGLKPFNMKCVFSSEIDPRIAETYRKNFGHLPYGDITKILSESIPNHDVLCGGFPCQTLSTANNLHFQRFNSGNPNKESKLYLEIIRIAKFHQPKIIFLENVRALTFEVPHRKKFLKEFISKFKKIGYRVHYKVLNAGDFGIPQSRKRCYFIMIRDDLDWEFEFPEPSPNDLMIRDFIDHKYNSDESLLMKKSKIEDVVDRPDIIYNHRSTILLGYADRQYSQDRKIRSIHGHFGTVLCSENDYIKIGNIVRRLHVNELRKFQGLPDDFILSKSKTQARKEIGNAVIPMMIEKIFRGIIDPK